MWRGTGLTVDVTAWGIVGVGMRDVIRGEGFIACVWVGVFADDVPGVDETRKEAQTAQREVNHSICTANSSLDPNWQRWKQDGQKGEEGIGAAHDCDLSWLSLVKAYFLRDVTLLHVVLLLLLIS